MASTSDLSAILDLPILLTLPTGAYEHLTIRDLDVHYQYSVKVSMIYASQLGASLLLLLVTILSTPRQRRTTPMFSLNALALLLNILRLLLALLWFTSTFNETYVYFAADYTPVARSEYGSQVAASVMAALLTAAVMACLVVQTGVVLVTLPSGYRAGLLVASLAVAMLATGFRLALTVVNAKAILALRPDLTIKGLVNANSIVTATAIVWFSALFTAKLGHTVVRRFRMGLRKFGKMEVLLIMGGQTLIIPAIFAIIQFAPTDLPVMDSNILTLVTLFLPLSSLWAASIVEGRRNAASAELGPHLASTGPTGTTFITSAAASSSLGNKTSLSSRKPLIAHSGDVRSERRGTDASASAAEGSSAGEKSEMSFEGIV